ncbi:hypothetical protein FQB35_04410 [Crassaminicella thermophila]|uniref:Uncharacterized protein n=1 Tax=Crassaminicella thermophila TaxID=2599308 RepID=A0A5C0SAQ6_CRATE|nr:hypothetical protein [Crassaminicella thermophila]QEK11663.1 hypothetical protein FQB35_04410 [Crassaminicella thermophila]
MKCKVCGNELYTDSWSEYDFGTVETIERCDRCGFLEHWSYGRLLLALGGKCFYDGPAHGYIGEEVKKELEEAYEKFERAIKRTRKYYKRSGKFRRSKHA